MNRLNCASTSRVLSVPMRKRFAPFPSITRFAIGKRRLEEPTTHSSSLCLLYEQHMKRITHQYQCKTVFIVVMSTNALLTVVTRMQK